MSQPSNFPRGMPPSAQAQAKRAQPRRRVPWGWLEWFLIAQTFIPALLFLPGISIIRPVIRIASFGLAFIVWGWVIRSGRTRSSASTLAASGWLVATAVWLLLLIFHPNTNSLISGMAQACLYIAVFSPVFWVPGVLVSHTQTQRLMAILLICNGLSAIVGIGQVFRPATFNPPIIQGMEDPNSLQSLIATYQDDFGNKIIRPCGLTDQIGSAAPAGATAALLALAFALRPIGIVRKLVCLCVAFLGVAAIYYSQVRMILVMFIICLFVLVVVFSLQRNFRSAMLLGGLSVAIFAGALAWVATTSGWSVVDRFLSLFTTNFAEKYHASRGAFVAHTFETLIWNYPLGTGLGWWGTIYSVFGDKTVPSTLWVEVMWPAWIMDGGIPLMVLYVIAIVAALGNTLRVALKSKDRELAFWAAVIFASNLSAFATSFSYVTFVTSIGMQFWLLSAVVHASDIHVRTIAAAQARAKRTASESSTSTPGSAPAEPGPFLSPAPPPGTA